MKTSNYLSKKMKKQLTGLRGDSPLHSAIRSGNLELVLEIISGNGDEELKELLSKQNNSGETALYVAAEHGHLDIVKDLIRYHDIGLASFKARNGFDAFHIAAKNGHLGKCFKSLQYVDCILVHTTLLYHMIWPLGYLLNPFEHTCHFK